MTGRIAAITLLALGAAAAAVQPGASRPVGVVHTYPAGLNLHALPEAVPMPALASTAGYDPDRVADKDAQFRAAAALPLAFADHPWRDVGPLGVDNPPGYSTSGEQFERVAGMGAALAADSNDPTGNTVYLGNMGGLWKSTDGGDHWTNLSDGKLDSAGTGAIALDPSRPGDLYVGTGISYMTISGDTYGTGFYVSHDGGKSFKRPSPNVEGWAVTVIRVTPSAVLVGTNHGLYRSSDHGDSLTAVTLPDNADHNGPASGPYANWISDIAVRPGHANEVTVAVGFPFGKMPLADQSVASPGNGLYRSTAGGAPGSFSHLDSGGLVTEQSSPDPLGRISLAYGQTPLDDGVLWAMVSDAGLAAGMGPTAELSDTLPNATATVFNGLFRSPDDGKTWTEKVTPSTLLAAPNSTLTPAAPLGYSPGVQAYYEDWVTTDPNIPDQVYFGLEEAYQTLANAGSAPGPAEVGVIERYADMCGFWLFTPNVTNGTNCPEQTPVYGGYTTHPDQHAVAAVKTPSGTRIYSANDGGAFRQDAHSLSTGTGFDNDSWTSLNTLASIEAWHVAMLPSGEILAALQDNGVTLSGADRKGVQVGLGDGVYVIPSPNSDVFYVSTPGAGLFVTKDHGHNLTEIQPGVTGGTFLSPIVMDPTDPNHLVAAGRDVQETIKGSDTQVLSDTAATGTIVSTDWMQSFDAGKSPATDPFTGNAVNWTATALAVRGADVYGALCATCSAYRESFDAVHAAVETNVKAGCVNAKQNTGCWHVAASKGLGPGYVAGLAMDPADRNTVYASVIERQFLGYPSSRVPGRVYVSHDAGESFTDITGNLPRGSVWKLIVRDGQLFAATDVGMFTTTLAGMSWNRLGTGLPAVAMRDAWLDPTGRYLLVSAYGRGVWMLDFGTSGPSNTGPDAAGNPAPLPQQHQPAAGVHGLPNTLRLSPSNAGLEAGLAVMALAGTLLRRRRRGVAPAD